MSDDEVSELDRQRGIEEKQQYAERQAKRFDRRAKYSLDEDNKRVAQARADEWHDKAEKLSSISNDPVHKISDGNSNNDKISKIVDNKLDNTKQSGIIEFEKGVTKEVQDAFNTEFANMQDKFGKVTTISRVGTLKTGSASDYGEFYDNSGELLLKFANKKNALSEHAQKVLAMKKSGEWSSSHPLHIFRHEIAHAIQLEHRLNDPLWDDKFEKICEIMDNLNEPIDVGLKTYSVSRYAMTNVDDFISECIAESMTKKARPTAKKVTKILMGAD